MWFHSFFDSLQSVFLRPPLRSRCGCPLKRPPRCRPLVEALEDRTVPSFVPAVPYNVGSYPQAVALGNFDADPDGTLDLVVANYSTSNISILRGNSDGTFQDAQNFDTGSNP